MDKGHPLPPWRNRVKKFTPIIRGEDAKRFLQRMMENHKETPEERDRREADYEAIPCRLGEIALRNFKVEAVKTKILSERSEFIFVQLQP